MTARSVPLVAAVTAGEKAAIERASRQLADALSRADGESWTCPCTFVSDLTGLQGAASGAIVLTSLHLALVEIDRPWAEVEHELHGAYKALCERGDPVMICTILRHVDAAEDFERAARIRRRIRKLNLLAAELSRQYGALVIDIDRVLADIGARRLETDFHLGGEAAAEVAARTVALCITTNALDAVASAKVQSKTREILDSEQPSVGLESREMMTNIMSTGRGPRKQNVATVTNEVQENHVGWLIRQTLKRQISIPEAFAKLTGAIRRRGARESVGLLVVGVSRLLKPAEASRR